GGPHARMKRWSSPPSEVPTMHDWNPEANEIFLKARELPAPEDRRALLDQACAGRTALRVQVEGLLAADASAVGFLDSPAIEELDAVAGRAASDPETLSFLAPSPTPGALGRLGHYGLSR